MDLIGILYEDETWMTSFISLHPAWLLVYRLIAFGVTLALLIAALIVYGANTLFFYTQWTFALVTFYFGLASSHSIYGCYKYWKQAGDDNINEAILDQEQGVPVSLHNHGSTHGKTAGVWGYFFQIVFQICSGAVGLTDSVFWFIIYPFLTPAAYNLHFLDVCLHSINAILLLVDIVLNRLRFPFFRLAYFGLWTCIFVMFQWIVHACVSMWWPYSFLDLSSPYAPIWYLGVGLIHLPAYAIFALIVKGKQLLLWKPAKKKRVRSRFVAEQSHKPKMYIHSSSSRLNKSPFSTSSLIRIGYIVSSINQQTNTNYHPSRTKMARKKIREYDSKRLVKQHFKRISGSDLPIKSAQVTESTDFNELVKREPWLLSSKLVVKPDMLFGKRGKSGLVALNLDLAQVAEFVKERLGKEVVMGECKGPITTFIVEPFVPHNEEFYINIVSERLGCSISFSECGGIEIEENWDKVKTVFLPTGQQLNQETCAPLVATLPLEFKSVIEEFITTIYSLFVDLDFTFLEMNPFTLVDGKPYPLDMRGELDDTATFKNFKKWGAIEFPMPFGRVMSPTESFIHGLDEKTSASLKFTVLNPKGRIWTMVAGGGASVIYADTVGDLGYASELGNYAEYSGAPNEEEVLQYARVVIDCATADPDGQRRALVVGGGIANFTDVAATFNGIIRAMKEKESKLKAANMHIYVRRGGPNYQRGLARMRTLGAEIGIPIEVYGPEATMTGICKQAIECIMVGA
ncbi:hypothetical protein QVD17_40682 [Tagetes erecta]|uniref:ATP citrate synthase n=1 Tax=Tagetes erecta TaxID=13708 RepID=A0AAD8NH09_TARER|nr:hypothetical protein QVD17_40682 [Tagetes erecta]